MVEGSLWVYGRTDLADYYRGDLTLRQIANRLRSLPVEAPIWRVIEDQQAKAEEHQKVAEIEATLAKFKP